VTWNYAYTPNIYPSAGTALFLLLLAGYSWRQRRFSGPISLMIGCLFGTAIAAGSVMEFAAVEVAAKISWYRFQGPYALPVVTALFCFLLEFALPGRWLNRCNFILLSFVPLVFHGLIVPSCFHHPVWMMAKANVFHTTLPIALFAMAFKSFM
jgi:hypothetical protein